MKSKIKGSCEFCDMTTIELKDVFINPTKEQIEVWNEEYGKSEIDGVLDFNYKDLIIDYIRNEIWLWIKAKEMN